MTPESREHRSIGSFVIYSDIHVHSHVFAGIEATGGGQRGGAHHHGVWDQDLAIKLPVCELLGKPLLIIQ